MKKANAVKVEALEEDEELEALLYLIRMQDEIDKKLQLLVVAVATTGE